MNVRWQQYLTDHLEFDKKMKENISWLNGIKNKLEYCSDLSASSQEDLDRKLETIQVKIFDVPTYNTVLNFMNYMN